MNIADAYRNSVLISRHCRFSISAQAIAHSPFDCAFAQPQQRSIGVLQLVNAIDANAQKVVPLAKIEPLVKGTGQLRRHRPKQPASGG